MRIVREAAACDHLKLGRGRLLEPSLFRRGGAVGDAWGRGGGGEAEEMVLSYDDIKLKIRFKFVWNFEFQK